MINGLTTRISNAPEVELDAVPHLKGLIKGKKISGRQERGSTFT